MLNHPALPTLGIHRGRRDGSPKARVLSWEHLQWVRLLKFGISKLGIYSLGSTLDNHIFLNILFFSPCLEFFLCKMWLVISTSEWKVRGIQNCKDMDHKALTSVTAFLSTQSTWLFPSRRFHWSNFFQHRKPTFFFNFSDFSQETMTTENHNFFCH